MLTVFFKRFQHCIPLILMVASGCLLVSCKNASAPPPLPEMTFTRFQPIYLNVGNVDVTDEYKSPEREPNVEHLLPVSPMDAMHTWVKDRLKPAGSDKSLQIIIKDASVVSHGPATPDPLLGPAPNRRYDARLEVEMRIYGSDAMSEANLDVIATQTITLSDSTSLDARKRIFYRMVYDLMESANAELEKEIFAYFSRYIMYAQTP